MEVFIGADHRGYSLKETLKIWIHDHGFSVTDCGSFAYDRNDDFTVYTFDVAKRVSIDGGSVTDLVPPALGIVICGSGGGVTIAANKVRGVRCGQGVNKDDVIHNRKHDNINVLAIGADFVKDDEAKTMVEAFLSTPFAHEERLIRRLRAIEDFETSR